MNIISYAHSQIGNGLLSDMQEFCPNPSAKDVAQMVVEQGFNQGDITEAPSKSEMKDLVQAMKYYV